MEKLSPVSLRVAQEAVEVCLDADLPVWLWGPPGIGKSQSVAAAASRRGWPLVIVHCPLWQSIDLRGLPRLSGERTSWAPPEALPAEDGPGILLLEELAAAERSVFAALLQLVLDRRIQDYELPPGWRIAACGNPVAGRAIAPALAARFCHLSIRPVASEWQQWAATMESPAPASPQPPPDSGSIGISRFVRGFLAWRPGLLVADDAEPPCPNPRAWSFVSRLLRAPGTVEGRAAAIKGVVGTAAGEEFLAYVELAGALNEINWRADPDGAPVPKEAALLYAVAAAIVDAITTESDPAVIDAALRYTLRLPDEFGAFVLHSAGRAKPAILSNPRVARLVARAVGGRP